MNESMKQLSACFSSIAFTSIWQFFGSSDDSNVKISGWGMHQLKNERNTEFYGQSEALLYTEFRKNTTEIYNTVSYHLFYT